VVFPLAENPRPSRGYWILKALVIGQLRPLSHLRVFRLRLHVRRETTLLVSLPPHARFYRHGHLSGRPFPEENSFRCQNPRERCFFFFGGCWTRNLVHTPNLPYNQLCGKRVFRLSELSLFAKVTAFMGLYGRRFSLANLCLLFLGIPLRNNEIWPGVRRQRIFPPFHVESSSGSHPHATLKTNRPFPPFLE